MKKIIGVNRSLAYLKVRKPVEMYVCQICGFCTTMEFDILLHWLGKQKYKEENCKKPLAIIQYV